MAVYQIYAVFILAALQIAHSAPNKKSANTDGGFVYPGPVKPVDPQRYTALPADSADNCTTVGATTFCTSKPSDYPEDAIKQLFKNKKKQVPGPQLEVNVVDIGNRQGGTDDADGCGSVVTYEPIYRIKTGNSFKNVVQAPDFNYQQLVRMEQCTNLDAACFTIATFPSNVKTGCKQKFATWKLNVIEDKNQEPVLKEVELPSCCSCHYRLT